MATEHPNLALHNLLAQAAREHKLDAAFIQKATQEAVLPDQERNASAYVNWNTTVSLLGRAPATSWFAGASKPAGESRDSLLKQPQDKLRDDLSVGVYYWWINNALPETGYFTVDVFANENVLFIDVYDKRNGKLIALFDGTPTMNVQIQGGRFSFEGNGLWGRADK